MTRSNIHIPSDAIIASFWDWFASVVNELSKNYEDEEILNQLDERVGLLGQVTWEVGPGLHALHALVITPDGAKEWLAATRHIVALAPTIRDWEFHSARPPKTWELQFSIEGSSGECVDIDARSWKYVLFEFADRTFDIVIEQNNVLGLDTDTRYTAAALVLDGILGEGRRLELIDNIEIVESLSREQAAKATSMTRLAKHLASLHPMRN